MLPQASPQGTGYPAPNENGYHLGVNYPLAFRAVFAPVLFFLANAFAFAQAPVPDSAVRQLWQLLDYVGVDYGGAVSNGAVANPGEYAEMRDFAANAVKQAQELPHLAGTPEIVSVIERLRDAVDRRADANEVGALARRASELLLVAYPVPVAPHAAPDLKRGAALYQAQCASCHGATGRADTEFAAKLDPKPIAFVDRERARSRSLLALYQAVSQGVRGTSMPSFATLPEADRWALAFYVGTLSHDEGMRSRGEAVWSSAKASVPDLAALTTSTEASLAGSLGSDKARDLTAYVRSHPQAVTSSAPGGLALARGRLKESLTAVARGDSGSATRLALSAYLDGFEALEPTLSARNKKLVSDIESTMVEYRGAVSAGNVHEAARVGAHLDALFDSAGKELAEVASDPLATFAGALTILLREGVEALLIVVGIIAFLRKADRRDALVPVHAGWIVALLAGVATWAAATYAVNISGANREVTEGLSSLFAALVLLIVGLWMHQKSSAGRWQAFLKDKLSTAISGRSAWALFGLSFIAVYREVFETVLFYSALALDGNGAALLAGLACGVAVLALIAWALLRTSARMPVGKFFSISSLLVAALSVILVGKGVAALQEAGWLSARPAAWPHLQALGMYPSMETAAAQVVVLLVAIVGFAMNTRRSLH